MGWWIRVFKKCAFWMGVLAVLLVLGRVLVYTTSQWQNVLPLANLPLHVVLHTLFPDVLHPIPGGVAGSDTFAYLPYYTLFVLSYIGYGSIIDVIIRKLREPRTVATQRAGERTPLPA